jgi:hypothetical protein
MRGVVHRVVDRRRDLRLLVGYRFEGAFENWGAAWGLRDLVLRRVSGIEERAAARLAGEGIAWGCSRNRFC